MNDADDWKGGTAQWVEILDSQAQPSALGELNKYFEKTELAYTHSQHLDYLKLN